MEGARSLDFEKHIARLQQLLAATRYTIGACEHREQFLNEDPKMLEARQALIEGAKSVAAAYGQEADEKAVESAFGFYFRPTEVAKPMILSFALVSFATEFEVFISQLVRCILDREPRLLKSLGPEKTLTVTEVCDLGSYERVVGRLQEKIVKEITDSNPRTMLLHHLGKRLGLFSAEEFAYDVRKSGLYKLFQDRNLDVTKIRPARWGITEVEQVFRTRHAIVHEGQLPVTDLSDIESISTVFSWAETFLALRAFRKFSIPIDEVALRLYSYLHGVSIEQAVASPGSPDPGK